MFNIFENSTDDINHLIENAGTDISINGNPARAIITNTQLNEHYDGKKITTLIQIKRGDIIDYTDDKYLIISESNTKRYDKYKALMRKCEYNIYFKIDEIQTDTGEIDEWGEPIYKTTEMHELFSVIIDSKTFDIQNGQFMTLPTGTISVSLQENADSLNIKLENRFIKLGKAWKIVGIDKSKKGLVTVTAEIAQFNSYDDKENEIAYEYDPNA